MKWRELGSFECLSGFVLRGSFHCFAQDVPHGLEVVGRIDDQCACGVPLAARASRRRSQEHDGAVPAAGAQSRHERERLRRGIGDQEIAIEELTGGLRGPGIDTVAALRNDSAFAALRGDPRYEAMLADPKNGDPLF